MWGRNFRVVIIPSILTLAYLGLSIYLDLLSNFNLSPIGIWLAGFGAIFFVPTPWDIFVTFIFVPLSMVVHTLVTGLIVGRIFKVFRKVQQGSTSTEKSLGVNDGRKYQSLIFVIIESGIALFAIQLLRVMLNVLPSKSALFYVASSLIIVTHQMLNVIITLVIIRLYLLISSTWLGYNTHHRPGASDNGIVFRRK